MTPAAKRLAARLMVFPLMFQPRFWFHFVQHYSIISHYRCLNMTALNVVDFLTGFVLSMFE